MLSFGPFFEAFFPYLVKSEAATALPTRLFDPGLLAVHGTGSDWIGLQIAFAFLFFVGALVTVTFAFCRNIQNDGQCYCLLLVVIGHVPKHVFLQPAESVLFWTLMYRTPYIAACSYIWMSCIFPAPVGITPHFVEL